VLNRRILQKSSREKKKLIVDDLSREVERIKAQGVKFRDEIVKVPVDCRTRKRGQRRRGA
jgi:hypothetical protein